MHNMSIEDLIAIVAIKRNAASELISRLETAKENEAALTEAETKIDDLELGIQEARMKLGELI